jgi:hypothetical protein
MSHGMQAGSFLRPVPMGGATDATLALVPRDVSANLGTSASSYSPCGCMENCEGGLVNMRPPSQSEIVHR